MYPLIVAVAVLAVVTVAVCAVLSARREAKKQYAYAYDGAVQRAKAYARMGFLFLAGQYNSVLRAKDVQAVRAAYLAEVYEQGYSKGETERTLALAPS